MGLFSLFEKPETPKAPSPSAPVSSLNLTAEELEELRAHFSTAPRTWEERLEQQRETRREWMEKASDPELREQIREEAERMVARYGK